MFCDSPFAWRPLKHYLTLAYWSVPSQLQNQGLGKRPCNLCFNQAPSRSLRTAELEATGGQLRAAPGTPTSWPRGRAAPRARSLPCIVGSQARTPGVACGQE